MGKHSELNINRKFNGTRESKHALRITRPNDIVSNYKPPSFDEDEYYERVDFRYKPEFKLYRQLIEKCLKESKRAMCIRDIHRALGVFANVRWTADALEMSENLLHIPGYVDKWAWFDAKATQKNIQKGWNGIVLNPPDPKTYPTALMEVR